eukprot:7202272-Prymnesium_polylepis.1
MRRRRRSCLLATLCIVPSSPQPLSTEAFHRGVRLHLEDKLEEATWWYRRALFYEPDNVQVLNNLGGALLKRAMATSEQQGSQSAPLGSRHAEAETALVSAVRLAPDFYDARLNLAMMRRYQGRLDDAVSALRAASRIAPQSVQAYDRLAVAVLSAGAAGESAAQLQAAQSAMAAATAIDPTNARLWCRRGDVALKRATEAQSLPGGRRSAAALQQEGGGGGGGERGGGDRRGRQRVVVDAAGGSSARAPPTATPHVEEDAAATRLAHAEAAYVEAFEAFQRTRTLCVPGDDAACGEFAAGGALFQKVFQKGRGRRPRCARTRAVHMRPCSALRTLRPRGPRRHCEPPPRRAVDQRPYTSRTPRALPTSMCSPRVFGRRSRWPRTAWARVAGRSCSPRCSRPCASCSSTRRTPPPSSSCPSDRPPT